jgi:hypothetical protein
VARVARRRLRAGASGWFPLKMVAPGLNEWAIPM